MSEDAYRVLRARITQLLILIDAEMHKEKPYTEEEKIYHKNRLTNLKELLHINMKTFAILFNRHFDMKLDTDPEIQ